jgi:RimJ/RimL family protein N-acetyltransferase
MTEEDWDVLFVWNNDPEVLYFSEGDNTTAWALDDMKRMYRTISKSAYVFIAELDGTPVGECWLRRMNLDRILDRTLGMDVRRIDLMIGEKRLWGQGWGTKIIEILTRFGFETCGADAIYGAGIGGHNVRSKRAFEKNGYSVDSETALPKGRKANVEWDMVLTRESYLQRAGA